MTQPNDWIAWGQGNETLIFLHYFGGSALSWQWVAQELSAQYRCLALNLPGFGGTSPLSEPSIAHFAGAIGQRITQQLGDQPYTVIGHSMSAKLALQMASEESDERIRQLILVAPSPPTVEPMTPDEVAHMLKHNRKVAEDNVNTAAKLPLTPERRQLALDTPLQIDEKTWRWWIQDGRKQSIAERLDRVKAPVTVLASQHDPIIDYRLVQTDVMQLLPQAKLVTHPQAGHLLPLEDPAWLAQQIREAVTAQSAHVRERL
ncbi:Pimeloyl-ACP methyl ester carboxylesterase [Catalinimonas alkaloidigena]|uniref:Pimeloyl-ACP methyl ester carboxylesterase n=1 Tax=Catalinimonas alkaloidigena TaxID=1075417 RepID=A0A1G9KJA7_9BACT|nr:alpha/beta hydrolase [Catalinimonas alkaloidigena]SDL49791.1 Pimeloyl-ACP methyl ester carboxylesterase [Catalinimonas alkaloidigena]